MKVFCGLASRQPPDPIIFDKYTTARRPICGVTYISNNKPIMIIFDSTSKRLPYFLQYSQLTHTLWTSCFSTTRCRLPGVLLLPFSKNSVEQTQTNVQVTYRIMIHLECIHVEVWQSIKRFWHVSQWAHGAQYECFGTWVELITTTADVILYKMCSYMCYNWYVTSFTETICASSARSTW